MLWQNILCFTVQCMTIFDFNILIFLMINYTLIVIPLKILLIHVIIMLQNVYVSTKINDLCRDNSFRDYKKLYEIVVHAIAFKLYYSFVCHLISELNCHKYPVHMYLCIDRWAIILRCRPVTVNPRTSLSGKVGGYVS